MTETYHNVLNVPSFEYLFVGFTSCLMMNFWRFCLRPKILLLCSRTCANASRTSPKFVLTLFFCPYVTEGFTYVLHVNTTAFGSQLQFQADLQITHMYSGEGEEVKLFTPVHPSGNVEDWLRDVEKSMKATLRDNIDRSLKDYPEVCVFSTLTLLSLLHPIPSWGITPLHLFLTSATSYRVGVIVAWASGDSWLSGLLDFWSVWGLGAGRLVQSSFSPTTDTIMSFFF